MGKRSIVVLALILGCGGSSVAPTDSGPGVSDAALDAGFDAMAPDTGVDASLDAGRDSGTDAGRDAGTVDAGTDSGPIDGGRPSGCPGAWVLTEETAFDETTGYEWQRGYGPSMTFAAATAYCDAIATNGGGWHLPTTAQLLGLHTGVGGPEPEPRINTCVFPATSGYFHWTLTPSATQANSVDEFMFNQFATIAPSGHNSNAIPRCVR